MSTTTNIWDSIVAIAVTAYAVAAMYLTCCCQNTLQTIGEYMIAIPLVLFALFWVIAAINVVE